MTARVQASDSATIASAAKTSAQNTAPPSEPARISQYNDSADDDPAADAQQDPPGRIAADERDAARDEQPAGHEVEYPVEGHLGGLIVCEPPVRSSSWSSSEARINSTMPAAISMPAAT